MHMTQRLLLVMPVVAAVWLAASCSDPSRVERAMEGETDTDDQAPLVEIDEAAVLAEAMNYTQALERFSEELETSETHSDAAAVHVWGSPNVRSLVESIDPDDPTQQASFPRGAMIVKEHFDEAETVVGLTVMYKADEGYDPEANDWFWARIRGEMVADSGRVQWCRECHEAAHNTDFVVGFKKSQ